MATKRIVAGFDVGTSYLKITVADADTGVIAENLRVEYQDFRQLAPGVVPVAVYEKTMLKALDELYARYDVAAIAVTTQMYSICEEKDGELIAYQWNSLWDRKPEIEAELYDDLIGSGCRVDTLFGAYKVATLSPERRKKFLPYGVKERLMQLLTGELATDYVTAGSIGLFDIFKHEYNRPFVRRLGLDESKLPLASAHNAPVGKVRPELFPGRHVDTIVAPGLGDGPSASYACIGVSNFCGNLGTSMAARAITEQADCSDEKGLWNFPIDKRRYASGAISSNACSVFHWAEKYGWGPGKELQATNEVMFFPWLHGERMPYWSSDLRGTFTGLRVSDGPEIMASVVIKAVAFTFVRMALVLEEYANPGAPLVMAGGGINIAPLIEVIAGCINTEMVMLDNSENLCSTSAAMSAAESIGSSVRSVQEVSKAIKPTGKYRAEYERWLARAQELTQLYK